MIQFVDETGLNPLPVGVFVAVATAGSPNQIIATGYVNVGGTVNIDLLASQNYVAAFVGEQAPQNDCAFTAAANVGDTTIATVADYRSPALSTAGYADFEGGKLPLKWQSPEAIGDGGNVYPFLFAGGSSTEVLDAANQYVLSLMRLQTCTRADMDSWARDYLGDVGARYIGETDTAYMARIIAMLLNPKNTLDAIQRIVVAYFASVIPELAVQWADNLELGGPDGGVGTRGGLGIVSTEPTVTAPTVLVWDRASRPDLADRFGIIAGQFVVQITTTDPYAGGFFLDFAHLDQETYLIDSSTVVRTSSAPDPRLGALVNLVKAEGYEPVYLTSQTLSALPVPA